MINVSSAILQKKCNKTVQKIMSKISNRKIMPNQSLSESIRSTISPIRGFFFTLPSIHLDIAALDFPGTHAAVPGELRVAGDWPAAGVNLTVDCRLGDCNLDSELKN